MKFYDNRFDFLRIANKNYNPLDNSYFSSEEQLFKANKCYCLPVPKTELDLPEPVGKYVVGEENVVEGSTCFFVNTGDLFILKKRYIYDEENKDYHLTWYKVGGIDDDNAYFDVYDYENPEMLIPVYNNPYLEEEPII